MPKQPVVEQIEDDIEDVEEAPISNYDKLADAIVTASEARQGPRKIGYSEWQRTRSVHRTKPQLARKYYQNGILLDRTQLTADAISMLNNLQPGSYADGVFQVNAVRDGNKLSALDITYAGKSIDQRMELKSKFPTFEHMLAAMLKEKAAAAA